MASHLFQSDSSRWRAVQQCDRAADGAFVYAVKTTKIYCRPICKARLARRANVCFYSTGSEAERDGFRACKRCKPDAVGTMPEEAAIVKIRAMVQQELARQQRVSDIDASQTVLRSVADMARKENVSKWHFHRAFKNTMGLTPLEWFQQQQREHSAGSEALARHIPAYRSSGNACSEHTTPGSSDLSRSDGMAKSMISSSDPAATVAGAPGFPWEQDRILFETSDTRFPNKFLSPSISGNPSPPATNGYNLIDSFLGSLPNDSRQLIPDLNLDSFPYYPALQGLLESNTPYRNRRLRRI